jgi:predicted flap endonuclease-1-like 5' DNA nuclease/ribosomal protein S13
VDRATLEAIALAGTAVGASMLTLAWLRSRRRERRLRAAVGHADGVAHQEALVAAQLRKSLEESAIAGDEAAWSASMLARGVARRDATLVARDVELHEATLASAAAEQQLDELRDRLRRLGAELADEARQRDADATRLVEIETELVAAGGEINRLRAARSRAEAPPPAASAQTERSTEERLAAALAEVARLAEIVRVRETAQEAESRRPSGGIRPTPDERDAVLARLSAETESAHRVAAAARAEMERLGVELSRVRAEADIRVAAALASIQPAPAAPPPEPNALLLVREAEIRDLEERLGVLTAARNAELRRLNERIAALERLYLEIEGRDRRIAELELELKDATETLEAVRAEAADLESRLAAAGHEIAAAREAAEAAGETRQRLTEAQRRLEDLETAVVRSRSSSGEVAQLRTMLSAERERNIRLVRRTALEIRPEFGAAIQAAVRPLQDTIARLEAELAARAVPAPLPARDDVTLIRGIGPKISDLLARHGITSLRQIAAFTADDIARIGPLLPVYPGRIVDDRWIDQARELLGETGGS